MTTPARLLLVDDDEANRDILSRRLLRSGYRVDVAEDGNRALELVLSRPYDLLLLDVRMPGIGGLELLRRVRERWSPSQLPVIMVTANEASNDMVAALRLGANDYVTTPLDFAVALARIETRLHLASADREVRRANDFYHLALRASEEGLWDWDLATETLYYSERWKAMLGYPDGDISGRPQEWFDRIHPDDRARVSAEIRAHTEGNADTFETEYRMRHKDGRYRWMANRGGASRDGSGRVVRIAGCQTDITVRKTLDPVTGLPNRTWLEQELDSIVGEGRRAALVLIDLDHFDCVAESLPDGGNDRLLASIAGRWRETLDAMGKAEAALVRSGESQFAVLLTDASGPAEAQHLGHSLQASLQAPFLVGGEALFVTACAGIATTREPAGNHLVRNANAALRHARQRGVRSEVFQSDLARHDLEETRLVNDLRHAVGRSEFVVYYQPKVDLATRQIAGFEALVRWNRPGYGLVQPNDFIPAAERTGAIVPIGRYVLERACRDTAELRRDFPSVGVSVNISGRQLAEPDLVEQVWDCLTSSGLNADALHLEVTETFLVEDPDTALMMLNRFRTMGVGLKLDDFGSGYASLDYLRRFPFNAIKVDRSFVSSLDSSHESAEILRAVAGLSRSLNMDMVAEGIETQAQLEWLSSLGCRYGQGYWFSRPVEFARLRQLLESWGLGNGEGDTACHQIGCGTGKE